MAVQNISKLRELPADLVHSGEILVLLERVCDFVYDFFQARLEGGQSRSENSGTGRASANAVRSRGVAPEVDSDTEKGLECV